MERMYPCDMSGVCPFETFDNPDRMYFCRDHCGMGCSDDDSDYDYDFYEDEEFYDNEDGEVE